jgi:hypothetical protein
VKPAGVARVRYVQGTCDRISRLLERLIVRTVYIPAEKNAHLLRPVKDDLDVKVPGIYCIPSECDEVYVGLTVTRCKLHTRHIHLYQLDQ